MLPTIYSLSRLFHTRSAHLTTTILFLFVALIACPHIEAQTGYRYLRTIAQPLPGQFQYPTGVSTDASGNVYVADQNNNRIQKFDTNGNFLLIFGGYPDLAQPQGVATADNGEIYAINFGYGRIDKYDAAGNLLLSFGSTGSGNGQFRGAHSIVRDKAGNLYVADLGNYRIQKFDKNGTFLLSFGSQGSNPGQFTGTLASIAIDTSGNLYVSDWLAQRVQKFDPNGKLLTIFGAGGVGNSQFSQPSGVAVDSAGNLYVAESGTNRVQKVDKNGNFLLAFGTSGTGNGQFIRVNSVTVDPSGNVWVTDQGRHDLQKFDANGNFLKQVGEPDTLFDPRGITFDSNQNLLVSDSGRNRVVRFDRVGNILTTFTGQTSVFGPFTPDGITTDPISNIFVTESLTGQIFKFDTTGKQLGFFGGIGSGPGQFHSARGIAADTSGNVYVVDYGNNRVQKFNNQGVFIGSIGSFGSGNGQFNAPASIALDSAGNFWVSDDLRTQKFNALGQYLTQTNRQVFASYGLAVDSKGSLYASIFDPTNRMAKFGSDGTLTAVFGAYGGKTGQLAFPAGIAVDNAGNVYVADPNNCRITVFAPAGTGLDILQTPAPTVTRDKKTNDLLVSVTVINLGSKTITGGKVVQARLNGVLAIGSLPIVLPDLPAGITTTVTLRFPSTAAASKTQATVRVDMTIGPQKYVGTALTATIL